ncbi:PDZ domain-containing protein [Microbulbifer sp. ARAS458-1]|uniref:PDZ domain-containing protein n=1 Tax=Microbulbifer sp. ARAS458-1 TaxID=3140242 RepID=UPI003877CD63
MQSNVHPLHRYRVPVTVVLLLIIGSAATHWLPLGTDTEASADTSTPPSESPQSVETRLATLERTLDQTLKIQGQLLDLVNELSARLDPESEPPQTRHASVVMESADVQPAPEPNRSQRIRNRFERQRQNQVQQLVDAGFSHGRATAIVEKQERLQYEQMQYSYEYHHLQDKRSDRAKELQEKLQTYSNPRRVFEQELSTEEFEQYLNAYGGRTELEIGDLVDSAPAYEAGLRPGDKIIRYNNKRVFHMGDLRTQVYQAKPGESVAVEVQRQGSSSTETIYLPAGPLGIRG